MPEFQCRVRPLVTPCWSLRRRPGGGGARVVWGWALFFVWGGGGPGQQPAGDLAGLRDRRSRVRGGECLPEWPDVAAGGLLGAGPPPFPPFGGGGRELGADGRLAAGPALFPQFGVERGGVGDAVVPPLAQVRGEVIQFRFPA